MRQVALNVKRANADEICGRDTYQIKVYGESDTLIHTEPITGKTWTYLEAQEIADSGLGRLNNHLRVEIRTFDGDLVEAFRMIEWEFDRV